MRADHDYYEILDVARDAGSEDLRSAYRRLLRTCHPDVGGSPALFDLVNEAYCALSNPQRRADYDAGHEAPAAPSAPAPAAPATPPREATHDDLTYASLRRARSSVWRPQPSSPYASGTAPKAPLVTLFL
ncbi:J domain-containing protein [Dermatophilaceae bacterium Soc4.6]